jgi:eukaryotic-like serine/threonine-protein kinase
MIGTTVMERFEIEDRLGSGGFGTVYRAWDSTLEREVAVKVIETDFGTGPRVRREAKAAARLNHPGIVTLFEFTHHEFGPEGGRAFLVSELVEGETVRSLIDQEVLSDQEVAEIGADICEALDHAHSRGVVHRDIKPGNLMYPHRRSGAKLMDFGIARLTDGDDLTSAGDVLGTLSYMSPEQAEGLEVGPSGDVFSLALTLFEAWTGDNPRRKATPGATARALAEDVPLLAEVRPDLPAPLVDVVDACLDHDPDRRPGVETLGVALEENLELLDDSVRGAASRSSSGLRRILYARDRDAVWIGSAAVAGGMCATAMILAGGADPASVGLLSLVTAMLALVMPRLGFLVGGIGLAAWLAFTAELAGAAFGVALLVVLPALLVRGTGRTLSVVPLGPLLGVVGLAPVVPAVAALALRPRDRAVVAVAGLTLTAIAEAITGRRLLFGRFAEVPDGWQGSIPAFVTDLLIPILTSSTYLVALAVWLTITVLLGGLFSRLRDRSAGVPPQALRLAAVESERVPNAQ